MELPIRPSDPSDGSDEASASRAGRIPIERAAHELGIARGALWRKLVDSGVPIHRARTNGLEEALIDAVTFERLRNGLNRRGPRRLVPPQPAAPTVGAPSSTSISDRVRRLESERERARLEASMFERQLNEERERADAAERSLASLHDDKARLEARLDEAERLIATQAGKAQLLVASETRADELARRFLAMKDELARAQERARLADRLQAEVAEGRERLRRAEERANQAAIELERERSEHAEELAQRDLELDRRASRNGGLKCQLGRVRRRLADAQRELEVLKEVERSQAAYCDRLEERLRDAGAA